MLRLLRRPTTAIARALVLALVLGSVSSYTAHADDGHDPCDGPSALVDGHLGIRQTGDRGDQPQHCDICHWLRLLRVSQVVAIGPIAHLSALSSAAEAATAAILDCSPTHIPARAPPA